MNFLNLTGETIKNWRPRYFYLFEDGAFLGFKQNLDNPLGAEPLNNFTVRGCQIMKMENRNTRKAFTFVIRGLSENRILERFFCVENERDRQDWINSIERVAEMIGTGPSNLVISGNVATESGPSAGSMAFIDSLTSSGTVSENKMLTNTPVGSIDSFGSNSSSMDVDLTNKFSIQGSCTRKGKNKVVSAARHNEGIA